MAIQVEELNDTNCKTYLLSCNGRAALIDPVRERFETYRKKIGERGLALDWIIETHTHADHLMFNRTLKDALGGKWVMHRSSPIPNIDHHVVDGDTIELGGETIEFWHTPGHTPDSMCLSMVGAVLTGDTMFIGGSGRTDFPGGDAGTQYDAVTQRLFALPDDTVVWPGHDYKGNTSSTIAEQRASNPRFLGRSRAEYIEVMANLGLPFPDRIQEALQVNQSGFEAGEVDFPSVHDVASVPSMSVGQLAERLAGSDRPLLFDVREPEEFVGRLGHIEGSLHVTMDALKARLPKLAGYCDQDVVLVCRSGSRSATVAAILRQHGFAGVRNLTGGMVAWVDAGHPIQR